MKKSAAPPNRVFVLDAPDKFASRARLTFARVTEIPNASLVKLPQARNEVALILRGAGGETIGGEQVALPFATGVRGEYWLSAKMILAPYQDKYALKSISLSVFRGEARAEKTALIRAEWDCPVGIINSHAQPHWHAYPAMFSTPASNATSLADFEQPIIFELSADNEEDDVPTSPEASGFTHVHLAMAATWHLPKKQAQYRVEMTSEAEAFAWIENCTSYLKSQLTELC